MNSENDIREGEAAINLEELNALRNKQEQSEESAHCCCGCEPEGECSDGTLNSESVCEDESCVCDETEASADDASETISSVPSRPLVEATPEMFETATKTLATMLDYLCLDAGVSCSSPEKATKINLDVSSENAGRIIGRKGQSLESLQLLLNRMMQKNDPDFPRVYINIDGYSTHNPESKGRRRREGKFKDSESSSGMGAPRRNSRRSYEEGDDGGDSGRDIMLRQQAIDTAKEVRRWGESVTLPPMNAHDRRIVHITLESDTDLQTESLGEGAKKSVVISLKK